MFDVSFTELLLVVIAAVVFIRPSDIPSVVNAVAKALKSVRGFVDEVKSTFYDIGKEAGIDGIYEDLESVEMIKGDDGKYYEAYKIPDIIDKADNTENSKNTINSDGKKYDG